MEIDTFVDLAELYTLDLSSNNIETLDQDLFKPLINLINLILDNNQFRVIDSYLFRFNPNLRELHLNNNKIRHFEFKTLEKLRTLYIAYNPLESYNLENMDELIKLSIRNCGLKTISIPTYLTDMYGDNNQISHITVNSNSILETLGLKFNEITDSSFY